MINVWNTCHEDVGGTQNGSVLWMVERFMNISKCEIIGVKRSDFEVNN